jgi:hypothetical protein
MSKRLSHAILKIKAEVQGLTQTKYLLGKDDGKVTIQFKIFKDMEKRKCIDLIRISASIA